MSDKPPTMPLNRRQALSLIAVTAGGGAFLPAAATAQTSPYAGLALFDAGAGVCTITPEVTEGPFYFDPKLERADVTEGKKGVGLDVRLQVVDTACRPLAGARVDIWHCDAQGAYSGYPGQADGQDVDTSGQTFLRGWQKTDESGIVSFATIYPGWYRGRTTHIHFKVFPNERSVMTGQLFFPDGLSDQIFATVSPYNDRPGKRDTSNARDGIARRAGPLSQAALREAADAYQALLVVAVKAG
ncbi:intradiol ring-cleavage dioxygenase [Mesorhizobium amorphae]|uniref:Intradiol ring-cleavage dioxygenase n=1 Tax=Mesorhizobium amorphae CCNWGS0123 TaxID=1082933 RepID=G6YA85_9HYPH|nr:intradiol ring-cleavage dioxygenase [Mesorhizobium amorphae]ANT49478.1 protocatechuate dioxygenase [Mesorhizobium amorphae CCNWGS0123]EHH11398.1 intradiol ring-cleavage dioxygenase [Mesorhizobium amorphae CCNWGS0123]GLR40430.1 protocatechuate dioxygenase [Mesorhizobium amorphae]